MAFKLYICISMVIQLFFLPLWPLNYVPYTPVTPWGLWLQIYNLLKTSIAKSTLLATIAYLVALRTLKVTIAYFVAKSFFAKPCTAYKGRGTYFEGHSGIKNSLRALEVYISVFIYVYFFFYTSIGACIDVWLS